MPVSTRRTRRGNPSGARPRFISSDCQPRTIWIPQATLQRIEGDRGPLAFLELVTVLLTAHLRREGGAA
jgi:hypothetical protein